MLIATLLATTISLTMSRSADDLPTLALHYPLFLLASIVFAYWLPQRWRIGVSLIALPLVIAELVLIQFI